MKGCHGPSEDTYVFPPSSAKDYVGERVRINTCPVNVITTDVLAVFRDYQFADGRISISEKDDLPEPYLQAWDMIGNHQGQSSVQRMKEKK
jgi:hypothetical protein